MVYRRTGKLTEVMQYTCKMLFLYLDFIKFRSIWDIQGIYCLYTATVHADVYMYLKTEIRSLYSVMAYLLVGLSLCLLSVTEVSGISSLSAGRHVCPCLTRH